MEPMPAKHITNLLWHFLSSSKLRLPYLPPLQQFGTCFLKKKNYVQSYHRPFVQEPALIQCVWWKGVEMKKGEIVVTTVKMADPSFERKKYNEKINLNVLQELNSLYKVIDWHDFLPKPTNQERSLHTAYKIQFPSPTQRNVGTGIVATSHT